MEKNKEKRAIGFNGWQMLHKAKEFVHPANVTWKKHRDTTHDSAIVLCVVAVSAVLLAIGDAMFGAILSALL